MATMSPAAGPRPRDQVAGLDQFPEATAAMLGLAPKLGILSWPRSMTSPTGAGSETVAVAVLVVAAPSESVTLRVTV